MGRLGALPLVPRRVSPLAPSRLLALVLLVCASLAGSSVPVAGQAANAPSSVRKDLVSAILSEDVAEQTQKIKALAESTDPVVGVVLAAWRQGGIFILETNDTKIPFLLDAQVDADGQAKGLRVEDGAVISGANGQPLTFLASDWTAVDTTSKLRKAIKTTLDLLAVVNPDAKMRRDAITKLGQEQNLEYLPYFQSRFEKETDSDVKRALTEAIHLTRIVSTNEADRVESLNKLGEMRSIASLAFLQKVETEAKQDPARWGTATAQAAHESIVLINYYVAWGNLVGTAFRGLSLSAVLLVAALGLAITFGLMGIINMAHGEVMMIGAYTAYVSQNLFRKWFDVGTTGFDFYFLAALVLSFLVAAALGLFLERSIIRFLYKRPLESLLATWGVSLVLQQLIRHLFGAANVQMNSPRWLSGSFVVQDVLFAYNRLFVIGFAVFVVLLTYLLLTRTSLGLQIRAVMQNRAMASALGVRTARVNMMTFAFGSGLAGMAGACLSQISNVGPSLGQSYIVDCFMVVVLGGVGNLVGTVSAALGVGVTDQILQPWLGAVMGKITVLAAIILFLQWRPAGLFVTRSRSLEG